MRFHPKPEFDRSARKNAEKISPTKIIVVLVTTVILAACSLSTLFAQPHEAPVADGSGWARRGSALPGERYKADAALAVASRNLKAKTKIKASDFSMVLPSEISKNSQPLIGAGFDQSRKDHLIDSTAKRDIPKGKVITQDDLEIKPSDHY